MAKPALDPLDPRDGRRAPALTPIEIICRQLCLGRGEDPDLMVLGSTLSVAGSPMSDGTARDGKVLMRQWRGFVPEADAILRKLDQAGYRVMRPSAPEPTAPSPGDAPAGKNLA